MEEEEHRRRTFVVRKQKNCRPTNGENLDNISASLQTHNLLRTIGNLNKSMVSKELSQPPKSPTKKSPGTDGFNGEVCQTCEDFNTHTPEALPK